ncbi:hypothetical protein QAD02_016474 [Eretmocerus hayati]|uniref:Uncharacterized protein n=1 Tax=Eretmocerus hayati TaxID=131215 RepID=A0ACC2PB66_9HYME|nr:hypothetical protein QAD02_016474 [Eretmocerus hayati]
MSDPIVETRLGKLKGSIEVNILGNSYYAYKGVPYAKPPVGQLRFQDPKPVEPWIDIRDATEFAPICAQKSFLGKFEGSDDCLYLNIYVNSMDASKCRPVMVWIHGGGFVSGDGNDGLYSPDYLMQKNIVLVTINYRLGVFGFLNLEHEVAPGNQGLKDQVMALQWIRDNITNFGGDPENVTIFGQSAGGASVHFLAISPLGKGLFHKAICQSGVALMPGTYLTLNPQRFVHQMCARLGFHDQDPLKIVEFLRTIDCLKLIEIQDQLLTKEERIQTLFPFGPGVDNKSERPFMPIHPTIASEAGIQVPLLIGYNSREAIFSLKSIGTDLDKFDEDFERFLNPNVTKTLSDKYDLSPDDLKRLYFGKDRISDNDVEKLLDLMGDVKYIEGIHTVVRIQVEKGSAPTYLYQYTYDKTISFIKKLLGTEVRGAGHIDELQHLFHAKLYEKYSFEPLKRGTDSFKIMEQMVELWTNFAATGGRPTPATSNILPFYWRPVNDTAVFQYFNVNEDPRMEMTLNLEKRLSCHKF